MESIIPNALMKWNSAFATLPPPQHERALKRSTCTRTPNYFTGKPHIMRQPKKSYLKENMYNIYNIR